MFSAFVETMELWALDNIVVIDGGAYAPLEPLMYAMRDAIMKDLVFITGVVCIIMCLFGMGFLLYDSLRERKKRKSDKT